MSRISPPQDERYRANSTWSLRGDCAQSAAVRVSPCFGCDGTRLKVRLLQLQITSVRESERRDETALFRPDSLLARRLTALVVMSCAQKPCATHQNLPSRTYVLFQHSNPQTIDQARFLLRMESLLPGRRPSRRSPALVLNHLRKRDKFNKKI